MRPAQDVDAALARAGLPPLPRSAWLAIDLDRLAGNLAALRGAVAPGLRIEPVVKADAYGHGAVPVALALVRAGADGCCVATFDEALELRDAGLEAPILVLYPVPPGVAAEAAAAGVAVTFGDETGIEQTLRALPPEGGAQPLVVHLELETGLGRGGVAAERARAVVGVLTHDPRIRLAGVWSHLGNAGDPNRSAAQRERFDAAIADIRDAGRLEFATHLAASGGILAAAAPGYDAIRPGLSIYGLVPDGLAVVPERAATAADLRPVLSLHARPVRVADLPAGRFVSYGSTFRTTRPSRIATLPVGYADGYLRALSNRGEALVRGCRAPLAGSVAMDALMVDVTDVPGPPVTVDDAFVLLGEQGDEQIGAIELARTGTTISWEVLAGMARRLPRVYYAGAVPTGLRTLTEGRTQWQKV